VPGQSASESSGVATLLLNAPPDPLGRFCFYISRAYQPRHDVAQQEVQSKDRRSQIVGVGSRLAIQPVPAGDQARECQRKLALRCRENLSGSRPVKRNSREPLRALRQVSLRLARVRTLPAKGVQSSARHNQGDCASRTAMALAVVSWSTARIGRASGAAGIRARRARWLRP